MAKQQDTGKEQETVSPGALRVQANARAYEKAREAWLANMPLPTQNFLGGGSENGFDFTPHGYYKFVREAPFVALLQELKLQPTSEEEAWLLVANFARKGAEEKRGIF